MQVFGHDPPLIHPDWPKRLDFDSTQTEKFNTVVAKYKIDSKSLRDKFQLKLDEANYGIQKDLFEKLDDRQEHRFQSAIGKCVLISWFDELPTAQPTKLKN